MNFPIYLHVHNIACFLC